MPPPPHAITTVFCSRECANDFELDDLEWVGRRDDTSVSPVRIRDHRPASLAFELFALIGGVEGSDRLRRTIEGGILGGHPNVREHTGGGPVGERGMELGDDQRTDFRLRPAQRPATTVEPVPRPPRVPGAIARCRLAARCRA